MPARPVRRRHAATGVAGTPTPLWMEALSLIALVMVVCLALSPSECREERPALEMRSVMACAMQGQMVAAQWIAQHPSFTLNRWRCEVNVPRQERI